MNKNLLSPLMVLLMVMFVTVPLWGKLIFYGNPIKNKTTKKLLGIEKKLAKKNGNAFLYLTNSNKGVVWSYCAGDTNHLMIYTISDGEITDTKNIIYNKSISWLDSLNTDISEFIDDYHTTLDPNSFTALLNHGKLKLGFFEERGSIDFPSIWVLKKYADSLGNKGYYSDAVKAYEECWSIKYEPFKDSIPEDHFFPNLARDIRDYVFPSVSDKRAALDY